MGLGLSTTRPKQEQSLLTGLISKYLKAIIINLVCFDLGSSISCYLLGVHGIINSFVTVSLVYLDANKDCPHNKLLN